jgi:hypothetical protein
VRRLCFLGFPALLALLAVAACDSTPNGTVQIVTGEETDTFTQSPVPATIQVIAVDSNGNPTTLASHAYPTDTLDLGKLDQNDVATLEVQALDANGNELIYGQSVQLQYGALDGETLPIFVQRDGQNARLPDPPTDARPSPTLGVLSARFFLIAGGSDSSLSSTTQVYDFAQFALLDSPPTLPIVPLSMPIVDTVALLLDGSGNADYYDFSQDAQEEVTAPAGYAFADVAGGQTIYDDTGRYVFVVGATRATGAATAAVLQIDTTDTSNASYVTGNLTWLTLSAARLGASAAWVPARGLVVAGGSATAAGVEIIAAGQTTGSQLPYPPDPSIGAGMTSLDQVQNVLIAGGLLPSGADAGVRAIDLGCGESCVPLAWGSGLPVPLASAYVFTLFDAAHAFLVGNEPSTSAAPGATHTYTLESSGATEVPTKVPHTYAAAALSPVGSVVLFGGANELESFTPSP